MNESGDTPSRAWDLQPGDVAVPHCTVRSRLGGGANYETYDAADDRRFTPVVVKMLRPHLVHDADALGHLRREIELLDRLRHPHIVRWLHHDAQGDRPYVALEKAPGRSVDELVSPSDPLALERLVDLGMGLATALHYMRTVDVIHLDILPRNVMMHERIPLLIDFDLARTSRQAAALTGPTGSPRCRAPEQCDPPRTGVAGFATDVWGLGMTLYMAATGEFPFPRGATDPQAPVEDQHPQLASPAPRLVADLPRELAEVVAACLDRDPAHRPRPDEVYFALQALSVDGDTSVRARPDAPPQAPSREDDRRRFERALQAKGRGRRPRPR